MGSPTMPNDAIAPSSSAAPRVNALLEKAWSKGWLSRPVLEPDALIGAARARTGLQDLGAEPGWRERLELLLHALHEEAALTPLGKVIAYGQLVAALANRARAHTLWQRHPEILDIPIPAPIVVLGQMRSGSTRMQRLLACDPRLAHTRFFESWNPLPGARLGRIDDRMLRGWIGLRCAHWLNPEFGIIHPTGTCQPDEEIGLHNVSIFGSAFEAQWRVPSFAAAGEAMDAVPVYTEFKRLLQSIAWLRGERGDRPWILKVPQLTQDLGALLEVFPDARLVCLDRPAAALVASSASLVHSQMRMQSDAVDRDWIGREWLRKIALRQRRMRAARARADVPQVDVDFDTMNADWAGEMQRVYRALGMALTPAVEQRMARYMAQPAHRKLGGHRYTLEAFGLSRQEVDAAMVAAPSSDRLRLVPSAIEHKAEPAQTRIRAG
ncbi:sulfotransferase family protein [Sphingomonas sp. S2-65]|uniref:sulfotransferase family protein n=1 Tax=Sphingomonas sp. S2-65 TaxID=2903960 RepID=UPI001F2D3ED4|nr:sulfotransferase [Sphingomonas sp. S2-65]UYY58595.1 sulfotransferase [Sphingomonas sp. S2-65]